MRFLITAGSTREAIDRVRDWGNIFTGNTGYAIARALSELGPVDLFTSNRAHLAELEKGATAHPIHGHAFSTHADLKGLLERAIRENKYTGVLMSAAISDYQPDGSFEVIDRRPLAEGGETWTVRNVQAAKVKSHYDQIAFLGRRAEKLVDLFRSAWGYEGVLVKFKLEVDIPHENLIQVGQQSRVASGANYLVANTLDMVQGNKPGAFLLSDAGAEWVDRDELPARMARLMTEELK